MLDCDYTWDWSIGVCCAIMGGRWSQKGHCGISCLSAKEASNSATIGFGACICDSHWADSVSRIAAFVGSHVAHDTHAGCCALHTKSISGGDGWKIGA